MKQEICICGENEKILLEPLEFCSRYHACFCMADLVDVAHLRDEWPSTATVLARAYPISIYNYIYYADYLQRKPRRYTRGMRGREHRCTECNTTHYSHFFIYECYLPFGSLCLRERSFVSLHTDTSKTPRATPIPLWLVVDPLPVHCNLFCLLFFPPRVRPGDDMAPQTRCESALRGWGTITVTN